MIYNYKSEQPKDFDFSKTTTSMYVLEAMVKQAHRRNDYLANIQTNFEENSDNFEILKESLSDSIQKGLSSILLSTNDICVKALSSSIMHISASFDNLEKLQAQLPKNFAVFKFELGEYTIDRPIHFELLDELIGEISNGNVETGVFKDRKHKVYNEVMTSIIDNKDKITDKSKFIKVCKNYFRQDTNKKTSILVDANVINRLQSTQLFKIPTTINQIVNTELMKFNKYSGILSQYVQKLKIGEIDSTNEMITYTRSIIDLYLIAEAKRLDAIIELIEETKNVYMKAIDNSVEV